MTRKKTNVSHKTAVESAKVDEAAAFSKSAKNHFEIIGDKNRRFRLPDNRLIDLRFGVPKDAFELYKTGRFKYIGLKNGAEVLFENEPIEVIEKLIDQAPRSEDLLVLKKLLKN